MTDQFDEVAAGLLAVPPASFVAERNARAAGLAGDLQRAVRALRKPTVAAWAVNLLSRDGDFREAVELSRALHEAQDDLDAAELARLGRQRRSLVAALARRAVALADAEGVSVSGAARDDVERTVNAAIVDPRAAAVVAAGRLVRPLDPGALDAETLQDRVAGTVPGAGDSAPPADELAERRARRAAQRAVRTAEREVTDAARHRDRLDTALQKARERADLLAERVDDLRRDLARAEEEAKRADAATAELERERTAAVDAAAAAERALSRARAEAES